MPRQKFVYSKHHSPLSPMSPLKPVFSEVNNPVWNTSSLLTVVFFVATPQPPSTQVFHENY